MNQYGEKAKQLFLDGYNCAQAVVLAFADELDIDTDTALKISSSFGGGMGRLREVCGAVSGMFMVAGLIRGYTSPLDQAGKTAHYQLIQAMAEEFKQKNHFIVCRELLGLSVPKQDPTPEQRTEQYYKKRPCAELVADAAEIAGHYFK